MAEKNSRCLTPEPKSLTPCYDLCSGYYDYITRYSKSQGLKNFFILLTDLQFGPGWVEISASAPCSLSSGGSNAGSWNHLEAHSFAYLAINADCQLGPQLGN